MFHARRDCETHTEIIFPFPPRLQQDLPQGRADYWDGHIERFRLGFRVGLSKMIPPPRFH